MLFKLFTLCFLYRCAIKNIINCAIGLKQVRSNLDRTVTKRSQQDVGHKNYRFLSSGDIIIIRPAYVNYDS